MSQERRSEKLGGRPSKPRKEGPFLPPKRYAPVQWPSVEIPWKQDPENGRYVANAEDLIRGSSRLEISNQRLRIVGICEDNCRADKRSTSLGQDMLIIPISDNSTES